MNELLMLIAMIITSIGVAALILALGEVIIIALPKFLMLNARSDSAPSVPARQRSTGQNKARSCPFC